MRDLKSMEILLARFWDRWMVCLLCYVRLEVEERERAEREKEESRRRLGDMDEDDTVARGWPENGGGPSPIAGMGTAAPAAQRQGSFLRGAWRGLRAGAAASGATSSG